MVIVEAIVAVVMVIAVAVAAPATATLRSCLAWSSTAHGCWPVSHVICAWNAAYAWPEAAPFVSLSWVEQQACEAVAAIPCLW